jgi:hypothetical protein
VDGFNQDKTARETEYGPFAEKVPVQHHDNVSKALNLEI